MKDWVTVKQFTDLASAPVASGLLTQLGVPNPIHRPPAPNYRGGECYLWVPPERAAEARAALESDPVAEDELTRLALESGSPNEV